MSTAASLYVLEDDDTIPASVSDGVGIVTNRNATSVLTATLPASDPGTSFEIHAVEGTYDLVVQFPTNDAFASGGGAVSSSITLHGAGSSIVAKHTKPGIWTGYIFGLYTVSGS